MGKQHPVSTVLMGIAVAVGLAGCAGRKPGVTQSSASAQPTRQAAQANELFETALDVYNGAPDNETNRAEAIKLLQDAIATDPTYVNAYVGLGTLYSDGERYPDAVSIYERGLKQAPDSVPLQLNLAYVLRKSGSEGRAVRLLQELIKIDSENHRARNNLAALYIARGEYEKAIAELRHVLRIDAAFVPAINNLGVVYEKSGKHMLAKMILLNALKVDPRSPEVNNNLGVVHQQMGEPNEAIRRFREALKARPSWWIPAFSLGVAYLKNHDLKDAETYLARARSLNPKSLEIQVAYANTLIRKGEMTEAKLALEEVLRLKSNHPYGIFYTGVVLFDALKAPEHARSYFRRYFSMGDSTIPERVQTVWKAKLAAYEAEERKKQEAEKSAAVAAEEPVKEPGAKPDRN